MTPASSQPVVPGRDLAELRPEARGRAGHAREQQWRELIRGEARGLSPRLARAGLWALSGLYGGVVAGYRAAYERGWLRTVAAECRIVSVGNLTVGGTGKSTTTAWLARWLQQRGVQVAVVSYGYRAGSDAAVTVVSNGQELLAPASVGGDEPRMLAEALPGIPVLIGKRRQLAAAEAVRQFGTQVCVLDDAFQYWRLKKDLEIVLVDAECPFGGGYLLPRGLLRESPRQLRRADAVIVANGQRVGRARCEALREQLRRLNPRAALAEAHHAPRGLRPLASAERGAELRTEPVRLWRSALDALPPGSRVCALSSLGNPAGFELMLVDMGLEVVPARYPDHHLYQPHELRSEVEQARASGCEAIVTTEKDAVKLDPAWLAGCSVWVLGVELEFDAGQTELEARLAALLESE